MSATDWPEARQRKFRQAGIVYLHVAVLYEAAAYVMLREGLLPDRFGPPWMYVLIGAIVGVLIPAGLYFWQNVWFARVIWALHGLRLPALIRGAFFAGLDARTPPSFYLTAIVVVVINLAFLARASWDL